MAGDHGPGHVARGVRFRNDPGFLAAARDRNTPERIMALFRVMPVCWLVYTALADRIRNALKAHGATLPSQTHQPVQHPTARRVFQSCVGSHRRLSPQPWPIVITLTEAHQHRRQRLGDREA